MRRLLRHIGRRIRDLARPKKRAAAVSSAPNASGATDRVPSRPARRQDSPARHPRGEAAADRRPAAPASAPKPSPVPEPSKPWDPACFQVPAREGSTRFQDLDLPAEVLHAIADLGFQYCTPIQAAILPKTLQGADAAGRAQTGTGKTAAFLICLFTRLLRRAAPDASPSGSEPSGSPKPGSPRALILAPTRELALQIAKEASDVGRYCPHSVMAVFGGMDYGKQARQLAAQPVDILVATPGRLLDYYQRRLLHLNRVEMLVIDEADRMLDMGFIPDVRRIVHSTPPKTHRQTQLFSATLTSDVLRLTAQWTRDPVMVEIEPEQVAVDTVEQLTYIVTGREKFTLLYNLLTRRCRQAVLIFANRRDSARRLSERLESHGIRCALLSGEVSQEKRLRTLEGFRAGEIPVVVATDVAGRGLHVAGIGHVINYDMPHEAEDYVHRIGRTGRAGATGTSISFASEEDAFAIPEIEKFLGRSLACTHPDDELLTPTPAPVKPLRSAVPDSGSDRYRRDGGGGHGRRESRSGPRRPRRG